MRKRQSHSNFSVSKETTWPRRDQDFSLLAGTSPRPWTWYVRFVQSVQFVKCVNISYTVCTVCRVCVQFVECVYNLYSVCTVCTVCVQFLQRVYSLYSVCTVCRVCVQFVQCLYSLYSVCTVCTVCVQFLHASVHFSLKKLIHELYWNSEQCSLKILTMPSSQQPRPAQFATTSSHW